jgi:hypothetical protein
VQAQKRIGGKWKGSGILYLKFKNESFNLYINNNMLEKIVQESNKFLDLTMFKTMLDILDLMSIITTIRISYENSLALGIKDKVFAIDSCDKLDGVYCYYQNEPIKVNPSVKPVKELYSFESNVLKRCQFRNNQLPLKLIPPEHINIPIIELSAKLNRTEMYGKHIYRNLNNSATLQEDLEEMEGYTPLTLEIAQSMIGERIDPMLFDQSVLDTIGLNMLSNNIQNNFWVFYEDMRLLHKKLIKKEKFVETWGVTELQGIQLGSLMDPNLIANPMGLCVNYENEMKSFILNLLKIIGEEWDQIKYSMYSPTGFQFYKLPSQKDVRQLFYLCIVCATLSTEGSYGEPLNVLAVVFERILRSGSRDIIINCKKQDNILRVIPDDVPEDKMADFLVCLMSSLRNHVSGSLYDWNRVMNLEKESRSMESKESFSSTGVPFFRKLYDLPMTQKIRGINFVLKKMKTERTLYVLPQNLIGPKRYKLITEEMESNFSMLDMEMTYLEGTRIVLEDISKDHYKSKVSSHGGICEVPFFEFIGSWKISSQSCTLSCFVTVTDSLPEDMNIYLNNSLVRVWNLPMANSIEALFLISYNTPLSFNLKRYFPEKIVAWDLINKGEKIHFNDIDWSMRNDQIEYVRNNKNVEKEHEHNETDCMANIRTNVVDDDDFIEKVNCFKFLGAIESVDKILADSENCNKDLICALLSISVNSSIEADLKIALKRYEKESKIEKVSHINIIDPDTWCPLPPESNLAREYSIFFGKERDLFLNRPVTLELRQKNKLLDLYTSLHRTLKYKQTGNTMEGRNHILTVEFIIKLIKISKEGDKKLCRRFDKSLDSLYDNLSEQHAERYKNVKLDDITHDYNPKQDGFINDEYLKYLGIGTP